MSTTKKSATLVALFSVGLIGVVAGGPRTMARSTRAEVTGAEKQQTCNATGINNNTCPKNSGGINCVAGTYHTIKDELPGTLLTKRYNNDTRVCTNADDACSFYTLKLLLSPPSPLCKEVYSEK